MCTGARPPSIVGMDTYVLPRSEQEYERLRAQARVWEAATGRLLDRVGLAPGARCLDVGAGPGETMRLMAQRVGPTGGVLGLDINAELATVAERKLEEAGHRHCALLQHDATADEPIPGGPYDFVFARILLFHLPQRVAVLARLWDAVAPGGHLVIQDYELRCIDVLPALASVAEIVRVMLAAFGAAGCDVSAGARLPYLFAEAGVGTPDGTDVAGRLDTLAGGRPVLEQTYRGILPAALGHGITTQAAADALLEEFDGDVARFAERPLLWPLLIGAWRRKEL
jgi:SAM-dependent methyltransferase